jgi:hypothetical protein
MGQETKDWKCDGCGIIFHGSRYTTGKVFHNMECFRDYKLWLNNGIKRKEVVIRHD